MKSKIYEINVNGIKCVGCKNKIEREIKKIQSVQFISVNVVLNQIIVKVDQALNTIDDIVNLLTKMKFQVLSCNEIHEQNQEKRTMIIKLQEKELDINKIQNLEQIQGITKVIVLTNKQQKNSLSQLKITYNPLIIKAQQIYDQLKKEFQCENIFYQNELQRVILSLTQQSVQLTKKQIISIFIFLIFIIFDLFFTFISKSSNIYFFNQKLNLYLIIGIIFSFYIIFYFGVSIYKDSIKIYKEFKILNMNTLVTISSFASFIYIFILFTQFISCTPDEIEDYNNELVRAIETPAIFITIVLIGKHIEEIAKNNIKEKTFKFNENFYSSIAHKLIYVNPKNRKLVIQSEHELNQGMLEKNDLIKVTKNDYLLCDSIIMQGEVTINQNDNYGHQVNLICKEGDQIRSGSFIIDGSAILKVQNNLEQSFLFKLVKEMSNSLNQKYQYYNLVDQFIKYFIPCITIFALFTFIFWIFIKIIYQDNEDINFNFIIQRTISVLVVSCPCAFGLAIPMITAIVLNQALKGGILIKNVEKISQLREAQHIIFDKNGTLTEDCKQLKMIYDQNQKIQKNQNHKVAQIIYSYCQQKILGQKNLTEQIVLQNKDVQQNGIKAQIIINEIDQQLYIGNYVFIKKNDTSDLISKIDSYHKDNDLSESSCIYFCKNDQLEIIFEIQNHNTLRKEAQDLIRILNDDYKKDLYILSGDQKNSVLELSKKINLKAINCYYEVDSQNKKKIIKQIKQRGKVIMIGDGLNDILSLSEADFGISFNANSNLNLISSDFIFLNKNLKLILSLIKISKLTFYFTWINIFWALIYNIIMIPFAGGYFYFINNVQLSPAYSSFSMLFSSVLIIITSFSIKLFNLDYEKLQLIQKLKLIYQQIENELILKQQNTL